MIEANAITKIEQLVQEKQVIEHNGEKFVPIGYHVLRNVNRYDRLLFNTLHSLVSFVNENTQGINLEGAICVVNEDLSVSVLSAPSSVDLKRTELVIAENTPRTLEFNTFHASELFNILLQTRCIYTEEAMDLFGITSKLIMEDNVNLSDDGMSQKVTIKKGMSAASIMSEVIKSRWKLAPYRIFPECDQPVSEFLVRLKGDKENGAYIGLWETDGGMWKVQAKQIIVNKLADLGLTIPIYS